MNYNNNSLVEFIDDIEEYLKKHGDNEKTWMELKTLCAYKKPLSRFKVAFVDAKKVRWRYERLQLTIELAKTLPFDELVKALDTTPNNLRTYAGRHEIKLLPKKPVDEQEDDLAIDAKYSTRAESYGFESLFWTVTGEVEKIIKSKWGAVS